MLRFLLALSASVALVVSSQAADLPTGTWAANVDGTKGDLVIKEVKDGKVAGVLLGTDFTGTWDGKTLAFGSGELRYEAHLVSEPAEGEKTKYTLTGTRSQNNKVPSRVAIHVVKTGWYAQVTAESPAPKGEIKAEVRGVLVQDGVQVYVSVKSKDAFDKVQETRVYVWKSEGEWKVLQHTLKPMYGKEIVVNATLAQLPKGHMTSIPEGALYFLGKFEPRLADAPNAPKD